MCIYCVFLLARHMSLHHVLILSCPTVLSNSLLSNSGTRVLVCGTGNSCMWQDFSHNQQLMRLYNVMRPFCLSVHGYVLHTQSIQSLQHQMFAHTRICVLDAGIRVQLFSRISQSCATAEYPVQRMHPICGLPVSVSSACTSSHHPCRQSIWAIDTITTSQCVSVSLCVQHCTHSSTQNTMAAAIVSHPHAPLGSY